MYSNIFKDNDFEYQEKDGHIAILNDSLKTMKYMKDECVDLIFADEPYNLGKNFGKGKDSWNTIESYINWNKRWIRSEEHTSELQSRFDLVCRLLLEKNKRPSRI